MPVVLFDIDGTLVRTAGAGKAAMQAALHTLFGVTAFSDRVPFSGRTDPAIGRDLLAEHGVAVTPDHLRALSDGYLANLDAALTRLGGEVCPGVRHILPALAADGRVTLGLLTGNMKRGAERKLAHFGLWDYFPVGGFGDVHLDRNDVARDAVRDAERHCGRAFGPGEVWVIGDTPLDVACARAVGARAVAVATGWHTLAELHATGADYVAEHFADPRELLAWLS